MTSRSAAPELETPETDAIGPIEISRGVYGANHPAAIQISRLFTLSRQLERRLSLAQTEIKGHMRVEEELKARIKKLEWDHYDAWAPMFNRLMMVCHRLAKGLPIRLEEVQGWGNEHPAPRAQARIAELEKDAARYRWLRDRPSLIGWDWWVVKVPQDTNICPEFLDEAIDAALKYRA